MRTTLFAFAAVLAVWLPRFPFAQEVPARWRSYQVEIVDEAGRVLPAYEHGGRTYVLGTLGQRYLLRFRNESGRRVEVVATVDGRDVVDGRPASFHKRGYVVAPYGELVIDGYRLSQSSVAAFRFSTVPRSYAGRMGDARDVGVIGVAVFPERWQRPVPPPYYPYSPPYQPPYRGPYPAPGAPDAGAPESPGARSEAERAPQAPKSAPAPQADAYGQGSGAAPAPGAPSLARPRQQERPGLGTEFGEEHESQVTEVSFVRASSRPEAVLTLRYDDRPGLLALGIDVDGDRWGRQGESWLRQTASPFRSEPGFSEPPPEWQAR